MKSTIYRTAKVLPGNRIEIEDPDLDVGQTVEIVILIPEAIISDNSGEEQTITLEQRQNFLKLPRSERKQILESQAEMMQEHYQKLMLFNSEE